MLFPDLQPKRGALPEGIDLRCCDVAEVLREARGARLVIADPPWLYTFSGTNAKVAELHYSGLPIDVIAAHVSEAKACAADDAYLALWVTWPIIFEWMSAKVSWTGKSGGAWSKDGIGVGFHWRGDSEAVLLYVKGNPRPVSFTLSNSHRSKRDEHSYKPVEWQRAWIRAWTSPGDLVLDLYAGLGSVAVACALEGRRYIGAEIDPERHRRAVLRVEEAYNNRR